MADKDNAGHDKDVLQEDANYLSPDYLETTNRTLLELRHKLRLDNRPPKERIAAAGFFFNKNKRTFHSHLVWGEDPWKTKDKSIQHLTSLEATKNRVQQTLNEHRALWSERAGDTTISTDADLLQALDGVLNKYAKGDAHAIERALLRAYSHLPTATDEYLSGLLYTALAERDTLRDDVRNDLGFLTAFI